MLCLPIWFLRRVLDFSIHLVIRVTLTQGAHLALLSRPIKTIGPDLQLLFIARIRAAVGDLKSNSITQLIHEHVQSATKQAAFSSVGLRKTL